MNPEKDCKLCAGCGKWEKGDKTYICSKCEGTGSEYIYLYNRVKNLEIALNSVWPWLPSFTDENKVSPTYKNVIEFAKQFIGRENERS